MARPASVTLRTDMNLQEMQNEIAKLGNMSALPNSELSLDGNGNEVLYLSKPSLADKLKRLVMPEAMRNEHRDLLISVIEKGCSNSGVAQNHSGLIDVKNSLMADDGSFQEMLSDLASTIAIDNYSKGKGLF